MLVKTLTNEPKKIKAILLIHILVVCFLICFVIGYSSAAATLVVTPSNIALFDSKGNLLISQNVTAAKFYWSNGTEITQRDLGIYYLNDIEDVVITSPVNGALLVYDSASGKWVNGNNIYIDTPLSFGNASSNALFEEDGTLVFDGNGTVWELSAISVTGLGKGASSPDYDYIKNDTFQVLSFDGGVLNETAFGTSPISCGYKEGSNRYPHIRWCATTSNPGNVTWTLKTCIINMTGISEIATSIVSTSVNGFEVPVCSYFTPVVGAQIHGGDTLLFTISRSPSEDSDTYPDDAALIIIGAWYEVDTLGYRAMGSK